MPIARQLRDLLGRIPVRHQRFGAGGSRKPGAQPLECLVGLCSPLAVKPGAVGPPRKRQARRLDDVRDEQRDPEAFAQDARRLHGAPCRRVEIDRHQNPVEAALHLGQARRAAVRGVRDEHGHLRAAEYAFGRRTEEHPAHAGQSVAAHHDEIDGPALGRAKNFVAGAPDLGLKLDVKSSRPRTQHVVDHTRQLVACTAHLADTSGVGVHRRQERILDRHHHQLTALTLSEGSGIAKRIERSG